jgi:hypothetical protein
MSITIKEIINRCNELDYFHGNKEQKILYDYWKGSINKGLSDFINFKFFHSEKDLEEILFFLSCINSGIKCELIKPGKKATELTTILETQRSLESIIFDKAVNNYTEIVNCFEFPLVFTESDIDYYLNVIRKPCFDYGLRIVRIEPRRIISYWDKTFNVQMADKVSYEDIFGKKLEVESKEIEERIMR